MDMMEVARALVAGCRAGRETENLGRLYAEDAVSVEAADFGNGRAVRGIDAIRGKHDWWAQTTEVLEQDVSDPMPNGDDRFAVIFEVKARDRESGKVTEMREVGLYHVEDGRIVREEFFYPTG